MHGVVLPEPACGQLGDVNDLQSRIGSRQFVHDAAGVIARTVVNGDDFQPRVVARQQRFQSRGDVWTFVSGRHQDRQQGPFCRISDTVGKSA